MKILNCPFCNSRPYAETKAKKSKSFTACANNKCEIFGVNIDTRNWNTRATSK